MARASSRILAPFSGALAPFPVIPAQAGLQGFSAVSPVTLDPRPRGDDGLGEHA